MSVDVAVTLHCDGSGDGLPCPKNDRYMIVTNSISAVSDARQQAFDREWGRRSIKNGIKTIIADMCPSCKIAHYHRLREKHRAAVGDVEW